MAGLWQDYDGGRIYGGGVSYIDPALGNPHGSNFFNDPFINAAPPSLPGGNSAAIDSLIAASINGITRPVLPNDISAAQEGSNEMVRRIEDFFGTGHPWRTVDMADVNGTPPLTTGGTTTTTTTPTPTNAPSTTTQAPTPKTLQQFWTEFRASSYFWPASLLIVAYLFMPYFTKRR